MRGSRPNRSIVRRGTSRGYSLLELTIAMVVLAVGLLGGIVVIGVASANNGKSKLHSTAVTLAEGTMEKINGIGESAARNQRITGRSGRGFNSKRVPGTIRDPGLRRRSGSFLGNGDDFFHRTFCQRHGRAVQLGFSIVGGGHAYHHNAPQQTNGKNSHGNGQFKQAESAQVSLLISASN